MAHKRVIKDRTTCWYDRRELTAGSKPVLCHWVEIENGKKVFLHDSLGADLLGITQVSLPFAKMVD